MNDIGWLRIWVAIAALGALALLVWGQPVVAVLAEPNPPSFGDPLNGLTEQQIADFTEGRTEFISAETVADGLGPVFNGRSCAECHNMPAIGGGSNRLEIRIGTVRNGVFDPLVEFGGPLIQDHAIGPADGSSYQFTPETIPTAATIIAQRRTPPLFGLGLVDAVPDQTFIDLAQKEAQRKDGTAGHVNMVTDVATGLSAVGKFGWKSQITSLFVFSGDAYLNEMGITNPLFPDENCPGGNCSVLVYNPVPGLNDDGSDVQAFTDFMTLLAPPAREATGDNVSAGENIFESVGCTACHVATLKTGSSPVAALDNQVFHPYSDFLLHDIGTGDGIVQGQASGDEIRTAPLWGLRKITRFLHDGRATMVEEAILAHGGQASAARDRFLQLSNQNKEKLLDFLKSL